MVTHVRCQGQSRGLQFEYLGRVHVPRTLFRSSLLCMYVRSGHVQATRDLNNLNITIIRSGLDELPALPSNQSPDIHGWELQQCWAVNLRPANERLPQTSIHQALSQCSSDVPPALAASPTVAVRINHSAVSPVVSNLDESWKPSNVSVCNMASAHTGKTRRSEYLM